MVDAHKNEENLLPRPYLPPISFHTQDKLCPLPQISNPNNNFSTINTQGLPHQPQNTQLLNAPISSQSSPIIFKSNIFSSAPNPFKSDEHDFSFQSPLIPQTRSNSLINSDPLTPLAAPFPRHSFCRQISPGNMLSLSPFATPTNSPPICNSSPSYNSLNLYQNSLQPPKPYMIPIHPLPDPQRLNNQSPADLLAFSPFSSFSSSSSISPTFSTTHHPPNTIPNLQSTNLLHTMDKILPPTNVLPYSYNYTDNDSFRSAVRYRSRSVSAQSTHPSYLDDRKHFASVVNPLPPRQSTSSISPPVINSNLKLKSSPLSNSLEHVPTEQTNPPVATVNYDNRTQNQNQPQVTNKNRPSVVISSLLNNLDIAISPNTITNAEGKKTKKQTENSSIQNNSTNNETNEIKETKLDDSNRSDSISDIELETNEEKNAQNTKSNSQSPSDLESENSSDTKNSTKSKSIQERFQRKGGKKGSFRCSHCSKSFVTIDAFSEHIDAEGVVRMFKCAVSSCPWSELGFTSNNECKRHMRFQHGHEKYICRFKFCGKQFTRLDSKRRHEAFVHETKDSRLNKKLVALGVSNPQDIADIEDLSIFDKKKKISSLLKLSSKSRAKIRQQHSVSIASQIEQYQSTLKPQFNSMFDPLPPRTTFSDYDENLDNTKDNGENKLSELMDRKNGRKINKPKFIRERYPVSPPLTPSSNPASSCSTVYPSSISNNF